MTLFFTIVGAIFFVVFLPVILIVVFSILSVIFYIASIVLEDAIKWTKWFYGEMIQEKEYIKQRVAQVIAFIGIVLLFACGLVAVMWTVSLGFFVLMGI